MESGVGVRVPWRFLTRSRCLSFEEDSRLQALSVLSGLSCNFVAVCLTSVLFIFTTTALYAIVHLLLVFKHFSQVVLKYTIIMSHNKA